MEQHQEQKSDWRRNFIKKAVKHRRAEYLLGSHCRETHAVSDVLQEACLALEGGVKPDLVEDGLGGTYFIKDRKGVKVAVFKPRDEEPSAPNNPKTKDAREPTTPQMRGVPVGEAALNEYAAFLVDHASSPLVRAGVPATALVRVADSAFHSIGEDPRGPFRSIKDKVGSFQLFAAHDCTSEDLGPRQFPTDQVHRLACLDIRLCNGDRHSGNILVRRKPEVALVPIDHGYALPDSVGECVFEWLGWPAAKEPFSEEFSAEVLRLDVAATESLLVKRIPLLRKECLSTFRICNHLLRAGVEHGLTCFDIGTLMVRDWDEDASALEGLVADAKEEDAEQWEAVLKVKITERCRQVAAAKAG